jgi:integrase
MDSAALEKLHTLRDQCRGSRAMAKVFALGTSQLRQNQKPHERCFQPCHSPSSNPIRLVRQSAKRRKIPVVLSASEVQQLLDALALRERTLVLLDVGTGLRMSELFGLKWKDVDFDANEISVVRSIVMQVTGPCKTESSQKPIPLDPYLVEALRAWLEHVRYNRPEDWVFANPRMKGRQPYWGQEIMRRVIRPIAIQMGITKHLGWHTFRHTYSTLLRANRADIKGKRQSNRILASTQFLC